MSDNKFENMTYEEAMLKLRELISLLERGEGTFDELLTVYKEAFEYYTFCSEYLSTAGEKIKELNSKLTANTPSLEELK